MNKTFKGEYIPFYIRLFKRLTPLILLMFFAYFKIYYGRTFAGSLADYKIHFSILLIICFLYGIYFHTNRIRTVVNVISFSNDTLQIIGHDFNSKLEDSLNLNRLIIEIQEEELGKNKVRYCLEIYFDDKYYYLNKFDDWKYSTLAEIVDEYKSRTGKSVAGDQYYSKLVKNKQVNAA